MNLFQWLIPWEFSAIFSIVAIATGIAYVRGCSKTSVSLRQKLFFWSGFILIYIACHTMFDYYAEHEFFIHRVQHVMLHHIGPFLLILSRPAPAFAAGIPLRFQKYLQTAFGWFPIKNIVNIIIHPFLVTLSFIGLIYLWLVPSVHFIAMLDWRWYRIMNWSMIINGLMFWNLAIGSMNRRAISVGGRIAMMLSVIPPQIVIGAVIFYASHDLYPIYASCGRAFEGITMLTDQQLGGLIVWLCGSMMSIIGILIVIVRELGFPTRNMPSQSKTSLL